MAESKPVGLLEANMSNASASEEEQSAAKETGPSSEPTTDKTKKKRKKAKRDRSSINTETSPDKSSSKDVGAKFTTQMVDSLLEMNPSLRGELGSLDTSQARKILQKMELSNILTGMSIGGKNKKDMASYKFWQTQPVPSFDDKADAPHPDGPITVIDPERVPQAPEPLVEGFEWCELDLTNDEELKEVYELLTYHYVEDDTAKFRFNYSQPFLTWALKSPGWLPKWHIGVRATKSRKLVASIFGIPIQVRIRDVSLKATEINFLCIHKKLRSKRLAPLLIKEVTRRCFLEGIYQAVYTAGVIIPRPISTCRYFHRCLDWLKLYEVGFSPLPSGSTKAGMIKKNQVPTKTSLPGLRRMRSGDVEAVTDLLQRYLAKFQLRQDFSAEEIDHWLLNSNAGHGDAQTVWAYVVEDPDTKRITDLVSFYCLESTVIHNEGKTDGSEKIKAAYLFYYASETAFAEQERGYKERLNYLIGDALVEAKKAHFDVFNALSLLDNPLFIDSLKFGAGDGQLHYYLYNYRTQPISGGLNEKNLPDTSEKARRGIGMVLL